MYLHIIPLEWIKTNRRKLTWLLGRNRPCIHFQKLNGLTSKMASQLWIVLIHINLSSFKSLSFLMIIWGVTLLKSILQKVFKYQYYCTAQSGGGSFKDRKPRGEFGCSEPWTADRTHWWIERCLESRAIYLSISAFIYQTVYVSICLSIYRSFYLCVYL